MAIENDDLPPFRCSLHSRKHAHALGGTPCYALLRPPHGEEVIWTRTLKNLIFLLKNKSTNTSLDALTIVGAKKPKFKHLLINLIDGKRFKSTF